MGLQSNNATHETIILGESICNLYNSPMKRTFPKARFRMELFNSSNSNFKLSFSSELSDSWIFLSKLAAVSSSVSLR